MGDRGPLSLPANRNAAQRQPKLPMSPIAGQVTLGIYAVLLAAGGVLGFVKAGSRPSLVAGLGSATVAVVCLVIAALGSSIGIWLGVALAVALDGLFTYRFLKSRKFMPSGMMAIVSVAVVAILLIAAVSSQG